jgi:SAM-dependent methyltransferase
MEEEAAAEAVIGLYRRHARAWAEARDAGIGQPLMEQAWLDRFLGLLPAGAPVLDLGCGTGDPIGRALVARGHPVTGVDASPGMLAIRRQRFPEHEDVLADMRELALGRSFAGLLAWDSFFHLSAADQRRMFSVFRAHAAPGAALMFTSGPAEGVAIGSFAGEPLHHASLDPAEYRALLAAAGFAVLAHKAEDPDCGGHTVWLARAG